MHMSFSITYDHKLIFNQLELYIMTLPYILFVPIMHDFLLSNMLATKSGVISHIICLANVPVVNIFYFLDYY